MEAQGNGGSHGGFRHEAFFYAGPEEFLQGTAAFLRDGAEAGDAALAVLSTPNLDALRSELNGHADRVAFADMAEVGANPARIIPAWREFVDANPGRRLRGIGEPICAERGPAELIECQRHESLLNLAFADTPDFHLLCPYDTSALDHDVLEEAKRSHPHLSCHGESCQSPAYRELAEVAAPFDAPLPDPPAQPHWQVFQAGTLGAAREFVTSQAAGAGLGRRDTEELVLAANEIASNSVRHGGGGGILRIWQDDGSVVCEVDDRGRITGPLVGRERPEPSEDGGYGVWLANQLCDLVQVRCFENGSAVRLHKHRH
jgi:anti-sigma regulatory factor (Ser/Thr protein kinase)